MLSSAAFDQLHESFCGRGRVGKKVPSPKRNRRNRRSHSKGDARSTGVSGPQPSHRRVAKYGRSWGSGPTQSQPHRHSDLVQKGQRRQHHVLMLCHKDGEIAKRGYRGTPESRCSAGIAQPRIKLCLCPRSTSSNRARSVLRDSDFFNLNGTPASDFASRSGETEKGK